MQEIEVDTVRAELGQAALAGSDGTLTVSVIRIHFAHEEDLVASALDRLGNKLFRPTLPIHLCCIDEGEAKIETKAKRCDLFVSCGPILPQVPAPLSKSWHAFTRWHLTVFIRFLFYAAPDKMPLKPMQPSMRTTPSDSPTVLAPPQPR